MLRGISTVAVCLLLGSITPALAQSDRAAIDEMQKQFAAAYNRQDADAMAALVTENAIRVTPNGVFQGRDAIRRNMQGVLKMGLHDYTTHRTISRPEGNLVFDAGEWAATVRGRQFHGYYSALVTSEGNQAKILEETVNVAAPGR